MAPLHDEFTVAGYGVSHRTDTLMSYRICCCCYATTPKIAIKDAVAKSATSRLWNRASIIFVCVCFRFLAHLIWLRSAAGSEKLRTRDRTVKLPNSLDITHLYIMKRSTHCNYETVHSIRKQTVKMLLRLTNSIAWKCKKMTQATNTLLHKINLNWKSR